MKYHVLGLIIIASISLTLASIRHYPSPSSNPEFRWQNAHWQSAQNKKMAFCFMQMPTMPDIHRCPFKLGVYI